jgi:hypothetical protein
LDAWVQPLASVEPGQPLVAGDAAYGRTFRETKTLPVHRWYSFVEGFSANYLVATLDEIGSSVGSCFDPFGGSGTTLVEAAHRGITGYYAEANPFMAFVVDAKVNAASWAAANVSLATEGLLDFRRRMLSQDFRKHADSISLQRYEDAFPGRDFFDTRHLRELLTAVSYARNLASELPEAGKLALLACASNVVSSSHMTRRADLRRRRPDEYKTRIVDVCTDITSSIATILEDLSSVPPRSRPATQVAEDCRNLGQSWNETFDCAVTSPPYLNGTNYVRNTKLELFVLDHVHSERDLKPLRERAVRAGITQAATSQPVENQFEAVEQLARLLEETDGDKRIPHMMRVYFSDMSDVLRTVLRSLKPGGELRLDIGDSRFYGVHIPTDRILAELGEAVGFTVEEQRFLAHRRSRDKSPLVQVELRMSKSR